jgi:hypothetical protein
MKGCGRSETTIGTPFDNTVRIVYHVVTLQRPSLPMFVQCWFTSKNLAAHLGPCGYQINHILAVYYRVHPPLCPLGLSPQAEVHSGQLDEAARISLAV